MRRLQGGCPQGLGDARLMRIVAALVCSATPRRATLVGAKAPETRSEIYTETRRRRPPSHGDFIALLSAGSRCWRLSSSSIAPDPIVVWDIASHAKAHAIMLGVPDTNKSRSTSNKQTHNMHRHL